MHSHKILNIASFDPALQSILAKEAGISQIIAQLLINRGIRNAKEADIFLNGGLEYLNDPFSLKGMEEAVGIVRQAAKNKEKVMIFSDYDVDGVTALVLLKDALAELGIETTHYIPHRIKEGYGLNKNILRHALAEKVKLLITADCGTSSHEYIRELMRAGIKVIVTDHHEPTDNAQESPASAIINPKLKDAHYDYRDLAGVGVAYKLCQAITGQDLYDDLDLVSIGTIADAVPLTGENRILVKEGLARIPETKRIGLKALMQSSGISNKKIKPYFISYILGPRINASGRMDTAETALNLLMSEKWDQAEELAKIMESQNRQRQKIESTILEEAQDLIDREVNFKKHKVVVVAKEGWHIGVLGVVASKLAERFYRPTILISLGEGACKGSGRSIKNFHLFEGISKCQDLLDNFGGHEHAVGLVINRGNIENFKNRINRFAHQALSFEDLLPHFDVDMELELSDLDEKIIAELESLEPFGIGNPEPLFYTRNLRLKGKTAVLGRETLKFWISDGRLTYPAIGYGMASVNQSLLGADNFDLIYSPKIDNWQEKQGLILEVKEIFFR